MTRAQIVAFTRAAVRRVLTNEAGVTPIQERHRQRLAELLEQKEKEAQRKSVREPVRHTA